MSIVSYVFLLVFLIVIITSNVSSCGLSYENLTSEPFLEGRIVGGSISQPRSWPWMISIQRLNFTTGQHRHHCGGTLIEPSWAITAAHCVYGQNPQNFRLHIGPNDLYPYGKKVIRPSMFIWHPYYVHPKFTDDIALIQFEDPVIYDDDISPICLPSYRDYNDQSDSSYAGQMAIAIGWGALGEKSTFRPKSLNHVNLPILTRTQCTYWLRTRGLHPSWLCAGYYQGGKDACQGDSGGPLVIQVDGRWNLIGVISSGHGCARPQQPGIYIQTDHFIGWIYQMIKYYKSIDNLDYY